MKKEYRLIVDKVDRDLKQRLEKPTTRITVFLLGPGDSNNSNGKTLRQYLQRKCEEFGAVIKGEHKAIIEVFNNRTGQLSDLCVMEQWFAQEYADAIIIIPYSSGSLVELGMFAIEPDICRKTMLIFSEEFPEDGDTFINKGPKLRYHNKGAYITFVNYENKREVWKQVKSFLSNPKADKIEDELLKRNV